MEFQEALNYGKVKEDDYFLVKYPDGRNKLFRLVKTGKEYVMRGLPTDKKVKFSGKEGYDKLFDLADAAAKSEYSQPGIFEDVHACGLPKNDYEVHSCSELRRILEYETKSYAHPADEEMNYVLASRCAYFCGNYENFYLFRVSGGKVDVNSLYRSDNEPWYFNYAVRPEAIPKPTMLLNMEGCDGSEEKPWVCVESQDDEENVNSINISKDEIIRLIKEGCNSKQEVQEVIEMLKEYAKNLK